jgi:hypothetical protein
MKKLILPFLFLSVLKINGQSMIEKCKPAFDTEVMMQVYTELDVYPEIKDEKFTLWDFMEKNFKIPQKDFGPKTLIKFAWMVEKDGTCTFLKLISPAGDKELEAEAKRVVAMLPSYSPAKCGIYPVPCKVDYEFTVTGKK